VRPHHPRRDANSQAILDGCRRMGMCHMLLAGPVVPYTRMTQGSTWTDRSRRYLASQGALSVQMQVQMAETGRTMFPAKVPLRLRVVFGWAVHTHDLSNLLKAVEDAANGIIWADDRWIDSITTEREAWDNLGLELWVEAL
jgi:Holliday junction resolvase RusA-like endonuclease